LTKGPVSVNAVNGSKIDGRNVVDTIRTVDKLNELRNDSCHLFRVDTKECGVDNVDCFYVVPFFVEKHGFGSKVSQPWSRPVFGACTFLVFGRRGAERSGKESKSTGGGNDDLRKALERMSGQLNIIGSIERESDNDDDDDYDVVVVNKLSSLIVHGGPFFYAGLAFILPCHTGPHVLLIVPPVLSSSPPYTSNINSTDHVAYVSTSLINSEPIDLQMQADCRFASEQT
jgi:hypothetical protein